MIQVIVRSSVVVSGGGTCVAWRAAWACDVDEVETQRCWPMASAGGHGAEAFNDGGETELSDAPWFLAHVFMIYLSE